MNKTKTAKIVISILMAIAFALVCYFVFVPVLKTSNYEQYFQSLKHQKDTQGLQNLKKKNPNFVAWLECKDVNISVPILVAPSDDKDYYLSHDFDNEKNEFGNPYHYQNFNLDTTTNTTIVGHSLYLTISVNGESKMQAIFGNLNNYLSPSANFNHQITLETFSGTKTYQVISVFQYQDNTDEATVPNQLFYTTNFASTTEFNTYIQQVLGLSAVNFNQTATYGDKFLTLYTCSLETDHRTMVIAKLVN